MARDDRRTAPAMRSMGALFFSVGAVLSSCTVAPLDLGGKACPCADGWTCDAAQNVCVKVLPADAATPRDVEAPNEDVVTKPSVLVAGLTVDWATSKSASLTFEPTGIPSELDHYAVVVGPTAAEVLSYGSGSSALVHHYDPSTHPELASFRGVATAATPVVTANVVVDELEQGAELFAVVEAHDRGGRVSKSNVASFSTRVPTGGNIVVFSEAAVPSSDYALTTDKPYAGAKSYARTWDCPAGEACIANPALFGLGISLKPVVPSFPSAYLEVAVSAIGPKGAEPQPSGLTTELSIFVSALSGTCDPLATCRWIHPAFTFRPKGAYRLLQVPLAELVNGNDRSSKLTTSALAAQGNNLHAVTINGTWKSGTVAHVDEVRIRW